MGALLVGLGALAMLISVFLPELQSSTFSLAGIKDNTLIQTGDGWIVVGCAVGGLSAAWAANFKPLTRFVVVLFGLAAIGVAIYDGTQNTTLYPIDFNGHYAWDNGIKADPGIGIYLAGVGGGLLAGGGLRLNRREPGQDALPPRTAPVAAAPPPPAPPAPRRDRLDSLAKLAELRSAGALSDQEFEAEKARILAEP